MNIYTPTLRPGAYSRSKYIPTIKYNIHLPCKGRYPGKGFSLGTFVFNPRLRQEFYGVFFVVVCFFSKNTLFVTNVCNSFYNVNLFSILNILQYL